MTTTVIVGTLLTEGDTRREKRESEAKMFTRVERCYREDDTLEWMERIRTDGTTEWKEYYRSDGTLELVKYYSPTGALEKVETYTQEGLRERVEFYRPDGSLEVTEFYGPGEQLERIEYEWEELRQWISRHSRRSKMRDERLQQ